MPVRPSRLRRAQKPEIRHLILCLKNSLTKIGAVAALSRPANGSPTFGNVPPGYGAGSSVIRLSRKVGIAEKARDLICLVAERQNERFVGFEILW